MFTRTTLERNDLNGVITIKGNFKAMTDNTVIAKTAGVTARDITLIFRSVTPSAVSFDEFFAIEACRVIDKVAKTVNDINSYLIGLFNVMSLRKACTLILENTWYKDIDNDVKQTLDMGVLKDKMKFGPLGYQLKWFENYESTRERLHQRGVLLDADAGTGKTYMSLAMAELLKSQLIVCIVPIESLETVWVDSVSSSLYKTPQSFWSSKSKNGYNGERFILCHYEALDKLAEIVPYIKSKKITVIIDELHFLNETSSKRSMKAINIVDALDPHDVIPMSGTSVKARASELYTLFRFIDKKFTSNVSKRALLLYRKPSAIIMESVQERFSAHRVRIARVDTGLEEPIFDTIPVRLKNGNEYTLDAITDRAAKYFVERMIQLEQEAKTWESRYHFLYTRVKNTLIGSGTNEAIFDSYEAKVKAVRITVKNGSINSAYQIIADTNKFEATIIAPLLTASEKKVFKDAKTIYKYPVLKVQGEILGKIIGGARKQCHVDIALAIDYDKIVASTDAKVVIFSNFIDVAETAYERLQQLGYTPAKVYGTATKSLPNTVREFMVPDNGINPLSTTYKSLSTAVPLTVANVMLAIDLPFRSYTYEQTISRIRREGQTRRVHIYTTALDTGNKKNIIDRTLDILAWSRDVVKEITGNDAGIVLLERELNNDEFVSTENFNDRRFDALCSCVGWEW